MNKISCHSIALALKKKKKKKKKKKIFNLSKAVQGSPQIKMKTKKHHFFAVGNYPPPPPQI